MAAISSSAEEARPGRSGRSGGLGGEERKAAALDPSRCSTKVVPGELGYFVRAESSSRRYVPCLDLYATPRMHYQFLNCRQSGINSNGDTQLPVCVTGRHPTVVSIFQSLASFSRFDPKF